MSVIYLVLFWSVGGGVAIEHIQMGSAESCKTAGIVITAHAGIRQRGDLTYACISK